MDAATPPDTATAATAATATSIDAATIPPPPVRTPTSTTSTTSATPPPLDAKLPPLIDVALHSPTYLANASPDDLRAMVADLSTALRDVRLSAAHYKLQHNMAVMESQEAASRMAVELAMAQRELDVLQQAEEKRRQHAAPPEPSYADAANAAKAIVMADMTRQTQLLQADNDHLRALLEQQKRLTDHREGELASLIEENDRLKTRIRKNRDHMAPFLEHMTDHPSPQSTFATPRRFHRAPLSADMPGPNNFEALLLADQMLSQESASTHPSRPRGHHRGAQSMSSLPSTPNRRSHPYARAPRTPPTRTPAAIPHSAPPAHYHQKPVHERRQSSNSTITASSFDEEEACTDREVDDINESQASQMAASMLRPSNSQSSLYNLQGNLHNHNNPQGNLQSHVAQGNLVQSKIFGHVKKARNPPPSSQLNKRRPDTAASPPKRPRLDAVGLGIGGLRE